jgi:hypothetical protein
LLAHFPTCRLPISQVVDLLPTTHAPERIEQYRLAMERGERFPPISVICMAGRFLIADGHKRYSAYKTFSQGPILVEVWPLRQLLAEQIGQLQRNLKKNKAIIRGFYGNPQESMRLLITTFAHWRRVAAALLGRLRSKHE